MEPDLTGSIHPDVSNLILIKLADPYRLPSYDIEKAMYGDLNHCSFGEFFLWTGESWVDCSEMADMVDL